MSRFLKLSTSNEALLLPRVALSAAVRSSPASFSCGSLDANVLENGLGGMRLGDMADCGAWYPLLELAHTSGVAIFRPPLVVCALDCPANTSVCGG
jgi:hypothetical protein